MDEIKNFFDFTKKFERTYIAAGPVNGRIVVNKDWDQVATKRENLEPDYARKFQSDQEAQMLEIHTDQYTEASECDATDVGNDEPDPVYANFPFSMFLGNTDMPIFDSKQEILNTLTEHQIVVIEGSTGCGKSTQVPQFIIDNALRMGQRVNIAVIQPRRIGAISIAERVCRERGWQLGTVVGYQIGLDKEHISENTRIFYYTTGVLLEKLIQLKSLSHFTHIILDEVHERDKNMDFLFIVLRKLLSTTRSKTKIILMSATIDAVKFAQYFRMPCNNVLIDAPIIKIEKSGPYTVKNFYLDDLNKLTKVMDIRIDYDNPSISDDHYNIAIKLITILRRFDEDKISCGDNNETTLSTVLVFLPGINEITKMDSMLNANRSKSSDETWKIILLHSHLSSEQQHEVFRKVGPNIRKIILSTNIAESSITVPDVQYVIDFCLSKNLMLDSSTNFTSLRLSWAAKNNCNQRSGRAGRVMSGRCYRLVHRGFFNTGMENAPVPELLRSPLENVVLKTKMLEMGPPASMLALAMDKPNLNDIANTILQLKEIGALLRTIDGKLCNLDGDITFIGRIMANLPLDVRVTKLIILGYCFSLLEECIIIGAGLSVKSIFTNSLHEDMSAYSRKLEWSNGSGSDLFAILNVYRIWSLKHNQRKFGAGPEQKKREKEFGIRHSVDIRSLHDCYLLVEELRSRLYRLNIEEPTGVDRVIWRDYERSIILKVVIAGAFYPNIMLRTSGDDQKYQHLAYQMLNGRDPRTTVYYTGFDQKFIRNLYCRPIKELVVPHVVDRDAITDLKVTFDDNTEKVFLTFPQKYGNDGKHADWETQNASIPGRILTEVYKAVKTRKLRMNYSIKVLRPYDAMREAERLDLGIFEDGVFTPKSKIKLNLNDVCMPRILEKRVDGDITHVDSCNRFWFQPKCVEAQVEKIHQELNSAHRSRCIRPIDVNVPIKLSQIVAVKTDDVVYRGKVINIKRDRRSASHIYQIFCLDYGMVIDCLLDDIYEFHENSEHLTIPPRCYECALAEIQPSALHSISNSWDDKAINIFRSLTIHKENLSATSIDVYSVVNKVAHVVLHVNNENINELLIDKKLAERTEEDYMSKANHVQRQTKQFLYGDRDPQNTFEEEEMIFMDEFDDPLSPQSHKCVQEIRLRGPFSPLETSVYSVMQSAKTKTISVDALSVNSIILDNNPQEQSEKYMVAAAISQSDVKSSHLILRETTLMPDIRGFGPLMTLLFCPTMELKRDKTKCRFASILSGLGYDPIKRQPIFDEHDTIMHLDVVITTEDIEKINQMRYYFDSLLITHQGDKLPDNLSKANKNKILIKIKELIIGLLECERESMELLKENHKWNEYNANDLVKPKDISGDRSIFPMHATLKLYPCNIGEMQMLRNHCDELHKMTKIDSWSHQPIICKLCAQDFENTAQLRVHMYSRLHLDRERQIEYNSNNNNALVAKKHQKRAME